MIDLLGMLSGAAFLAGSVALALLVDHREASGSGPHPGAGTPTSVPGPAVAGRRLRLVPGIDR